MRGFRKDFRLSCLVVWFCAISFGGYSNVYAQTNEKEVLSKREVKGAEELIDKFFEEYKRTLSIKNIDKNLFDASFKKDLASFEQYPWEEFNNQLASVEKVDWYIALQDYIYLTTIAFSRVDFDEIEVLDTDFEDKEEVKRREQLLKEVFSQRTLKAVKESKFTLLGDEKEWSPKNLIEYKNQLGKLKNMNSSIRQDLKDTYSEWKQNSITNLGKYRNNHQYRGIHMCDETDCFGAPEGTRILLLVRCPFLFLIVEQDSGFKILSLQHHNLIET